MKPKPAFDRKFITVDQLCQRWGDCSRMTIERKIKNDPDFPKPYSLTSWRTFALDEIEVYERSKAAAR